MPRKAIPKVSEGDVFCLALPDAGYSTGVSARTDGRGVLLGYYFGPRYNHSVLQNTVVDRIQTSITNRAVHRRPFGTTLR